LICYSTKWPDKAEEDLQWVSRVRETATRIRRTVREKVRVVSSRIREIETDNSRAAIARSRADRTALRVPREVRVVLADSAVRTASASI
jgi:hypothetical protein